MNAEIRTAVTQGVIQGKSIPAVAKDIKASFDKAFRGAKRIARTEVLRATSLAQNQAFDLAQSQENIHGYRMQRYWKTRLDGRERPSHRSINGWLEDKRGEWTLYSPTMGSVKTKRPRFSGVADQDINCRCSTATRITKDKDMIAPEFRSVQFSVKADWLKSHKAPLINHVEKILPAQIVNKTVPPKAIIRSSTGNKMAKQSDLIMQYNAKKESFTDSEELTGEIPFATMQERVRGVEWYTGNGYIDINRHLRDGNGISNMARTRMEWTSQYIDGSEKQHGRVFRGQHTSKDYRMDDLLERTKIDSIYIDKGFMSSSWDENTAENFLRADMDTHSVMMTIEANGIGGADVQEDSNAGYEAEVLFQKGSRFIVVDRIIERKPSWPSKYFITLVLKEVK